MIGPRRVLLALAAIGLGGSATALLSEPADTPTSEAADRLAMVDVDEKLPAPVPPAPVVRVSGHLNNLDVSADGILTLSGLTERDGSPADVPISVWIDNAPAEAFEPEPAAATDIEPGQ